MFRTRLLHSIMMLAPENGEGGGGEAGGGAPAEPPPPDQTQNQEQPPPVPSQPDINARMANLEAAIMQLATRGTPQAAPVQTPDNESETVDESQLHPELIKLNRKQEKAFNQQMSRMNDMLDNLQFSQQVSAANVAPEVRQMAEQMHTSWRQTGTMVNGPNGPQAPTRSDALRFVLGELAMQGKLPSQGKQPQPPHGGGQPPARNAAPPVNITVNLDPTKMTRAERIAAQEKALDEEGF
ncbi:hypothetical protein [Caudoviricetes sp.]|nr:hypothetical protein [Caudoviricetes sp.]